MCTHCTPLTHTHTHTHTPTHTHTHTVSYIAVLFDLEYMPVVLAVHHMQGSSAAAAVGLNFSQKQCLYLEQVLIVVKVGACDLHVTCM